MNTNEGDTQGLGNQVNENLQQNPSRGPMIALEGSSNVEGLDY